MQPNSDIQTIAQNDGNGIQSQAESQSQPNSERAAAQTKGAEAHAPKETSDAAPKEDGTVAENNGVDNTDFAGAPFTLHVNGSLVDFPVDAASFDFFGPANLQAGQNGFSAARTSFPSTVEEVLSQHPGHVITQPEQDDLPPQPKGPTALFGIYDPFFPRQWQLHNTQYEGVDINVLDAWQDYSGKGVIIGLIDDGLDYTHPDLQGNYLPEYGYDGIEKINDPFPKTSEDCHGTCCISLAAAPKNGIGIVGVAYDAKYSASRISMVIDGNWIDTVTDAARHAAYADVINMSYGCNRFINNQAEYDAYEELATTGRDGLGTVLVHAIGNDRDNGEVGTYELATANQFITSVAAIEISGKLLFYSTPSATLLVSAPGRNVWMADRVPENGYDPNASYIGSSGTSFATPLVTGTVALILEANPNLGYRDVQTILAVTAHRTTNALDDPAMPWKWQINDAHNWNGGGMHASHDFGFGLVDATAAVRLAESWDQGVHTAANIYSVTQSMNVAKVIPENVMYPSTISIDTPINLEFVTVELTIHGGHVSELQATLFAPGDTYSYLLNFSPTEWEAKFTATFNKSDTCTFGTRQIFGESGQGDWTLVILDKVTGNEHTLESWTLNLYGENPDGNDLYVYTNEFAKMAAEDATRTTLSDSGGTDTLNASAVSTASVIDLNPGATSIIDGTELHIAAGTVIEKAHGGDGNDTIIGNAVANELFGWRGNDVITGGLGADKLTGGTGADLFRFENAAQGGDTIMDFSHADDGFLFNHGAFGQAGAGSLDAANFFTDRSAVTGDDASFIFEGDTLWFDADGAGAGAAVEIAQVHGDAVQANDITFA